MGCSVSPAVPHVLVLAEQSRPRDTPPPSLTPPWADPKLRYRDPLAVVAVHVKPWHAFLFAMLIYGVGEKILLPMYRGYFNLNGELSTWRPDLEALFNGFISFPTIFAAYVWQIGGVRNVLVGFARAGSFTDRGAFDSFVEDVRSWFARDRWWLVAVLFAIGGVLWQHLWLWDPENPKPVVAWFAEGEPLARVVALSLSFPFWYLVASIVIGEVRLAWTLRQMWRRLGASFSLKGRAQSGGLEALSGHVAIVATTSAIVFLNLVLGLLLPQIRATDASPDFRLWVILIWAAYLIVIPGVTLALVWPAHKVMASQRSERVRRVSQEIDKTIVARVRSLLKLKAATDALEDSLRKLREWLAADLPSWPLRNTLQTVSWSAVVPLFLSVATFVLDWFV